MWEHVTFLFGLLFVICAVTFVISLTLGMHPRFLG